MARRYRKVDPRFWTDERIAPLAADEKLIALYCFTGQANRIGLYCFSPGQAVEETSLRAETFAKGFKRVRETLRLGWDEATRVLYLPTWWKYNCPENPNVLKACLADLHDLPRSPLLSEFSDNLAHIPETFHQTFRATVKTFTNGLGERMADQEQEQEVLPRAGARAEAEPPPTPQGEREWLDLLNQETGQAFKPVEANLRPIRQRLREGYGLEDARAVVKSRLTHWSADPNLRQYLRPITVFGTKFDGYLAESRRSVGRPLLTPKTQGNLAAGDEASRLVRERLEKHHED